MSVRTWHDDFPAHRREDAPVISDAALHIASGAGARLIPTPPVVAPLPSARTLHRARGEGPAVRCCHRRLVSADQLVRIPARLRLRVCARFPHLPATGPLYLCDACIETLRRENIIGIAELHFTSEDS